MILLIASTLNTKHTMISVNFPLGLTGQGCCFYRSFKYHFFTLNKNPLLQIDNWIIISNYLRLGYFRRLFTPLRPNWVKIKLRNYRANYIQYALICWRKLQICRVGVCWYVFPKPKLMTLKTTLTRKKYMENVFTAQGYRPLKNIHVASHYAWSRIECDKIYINRFGKKFATLVLSYIDVDMNRIIWRGRCLFVMFVVLNYFVIQNRILARIYVGYIKWRLYIKNAFSLITFILSNF